MHRRTNLRGLAALAMTSLVTSGSAYAQPKAAPAPRPAARIAAPSTTKPKDADADSLNDPAEQRFPGGAALKTDPEQQRLLKRAEQCVEDDRLDLAAVLWQKVLDEAGDTLMVNKIIEPLGPTSSTPLMIYTSLSQQVERTLARLPPAALDAYRTSADAEARALLAAAGPDGQEDALAQVVRRFFLSSIGDDAAYKLACLALDRHDFVGASRLLNKILTSHPDPSMPKADIFARLAVAAAHMQDRQTAEQSLSQMTLAAGARPPAEVVDLIAADVKTAITQGPGSGGPTAKDWHMVMGNPGRTGHMKSLPAAATSRTLSELWVQEFPLAAQGPSGGPQVFAGGFGGGIGGFGGGMIIVRGGVVQQPAGQSTPASREELIAQWRAGGWRPTGRLLFDGGRMYSKTADRLVCYSTAAISNQPIWQSAWENRYELDGMSQQLALMAMQFGMNLPQQASTKPKTPVEVLLFGDRVHQSQSIAEGVIYSIEGKRVMTAQTPPAARPFQWGTTPRRSRTNWLTAYQASGGKALWTRSASDDDKEGSSDVGFLAAPTPCGGLLLAPVTDGGTIWLFGLERTTGKTLWKAYLCDEPQGGASPWAEPVLAVEGREAYLTCGCGVVFAVDAAGGTVRWAVRYARDGKPNMAMRMYGGNVSPTLDLSGWDDDVVIPYGRLLVVMSSDSDRLLALDRRTGERVWESPRVSPFGSSASYCLGVNGRGLFVASKNVVRRYDIVSGILVWEKIIEDSFGRGCVTDDAIYMPVRDSVLKLDLEKGRELGQVGVALTSEEPVGSLFSDGEKLWVVGAGRVYAMTTLEHRLTMLAEQIAAGDAEAQLNRMRLYFKQNRHDLALADLRGAYARFQSQLTADEAAQRLFAVMNEQKLPQMQPLVILPLLTELFVTAPSPPKLGRDAAARLSELVASSVSSIRQGNPAGAIPVLLAAASLLTEDYLLTAAGLAVDVTAKQEDVPPLIEALGSGSSAAELISVRAVARLAPDDAKAPLAKLLDGGDDRVRLAAVRALANLGQRENILETLVRLLDSSNIQVRSRSHQSLQALSGQQIPFAAEGSPADRAKTVKDWQQWIETSGAAAKLNVPLTDRAVVLGRTLLIAPGMVIELDASHAETWRQRLAGSAWGCQGLPNGHRLIAINSHAMVVEYDDRGHEVWKKDRLPAPPTSVQRLDNGNTLVACGNAQQIVEIAPDGKTTSMTVQGHPISAQRLDNGNTLVALQQTQRVVEVDRTGKVVWEVRTDGNPPWHAVRLENGNTLVTLTQARKVVEYEPAGKAPVWQTTTPLINPYAAQRLPDGNTLVADHTGVHEFDTTGKQVRMPLKQQQVTGLSSF
jgi:outer membrane protein assembly factor BamB